MKFTLVFESTDLSLAAVFIPCLVWQEGSREILNPHPENPHYVRGDVGKVLAIPEIKSRLSNTSKKVTVVCHPTGHGTEAYLMDIQGDLHRLGFEPLIVRH